MHATSCLLRVWRTVETWKWRTGMCSPGTAPEALPSPCFTLPSSASPKTCKSFSFYNLANISWYILKCFSAHLLAVFLTLSFGSFLKKSHKLKRITHLIFTQIPLCIRHSGRLLKSIMQCLTQNEVCENLLTICTCSRLTNLSNKFKTNSSET